MALTTVEETPGSLPDLVSHALACRSNLVDHGDAATRLARSLAYDVALVRLCERLGVEHEMTGEAAGMQARQRTETILALRLPSLAAAMERAS